MVVVILNVIVRYCHSRSNSYSNDIKLLIVTEREIIIIMVPHLVVIATS